MRPALLSQSMLSWLCNGIELIFLCRVCGIIFNNCSGVVYIDTRLHLYYFITSGMFRCHLLAHFDGRFCAACGSLCTFIPKLVHYALRLYYYREPGAYHANSGSMCTVSLNQVHDVPVVVQCVACHFWHVC